MSSFSFSLFSPAPCSSFSPSSLPCWLSPGAELGMYECLLCAIAPISCLSVLACLTSPALSSLTLLACFPPPGCLLCPCSQGGEWVFIKCLLYSHCFTYTVSFHHSFHFLCWSFLSPLLFLQSSFSWEENEHLRAPTICLAFATPGPLSSGCVSCSVFPPWWWFLHFFSDLASLS